MERKSTKDASALRIALENLQNHPCKASEVELHACLKDAQLYAPVHPNQHASKDHNANVLELATDFMMVLDALNDLYYPIFSSKEELLKFTSDLHLGYMKVCLQDYESLLYGQKEVKGVVLDKESINYSLCLEDILHIYHHVQCSDITNLEIREIKDPTHYLKEELVRLFSKMPQVRAAYLHELYCDKQASYLLIIDSDTFDDVAQQVSDFLYPLTYENGDHVELIALASRFGEKITREVTPFYERKQRLLHILLPKE